MRALVVLLLWMVVACGQEASETPERTQELAVPAREEAVPPQEAPAGDESAPEEAEAIEAAAPIELIGALPHRISASSSYRNDESQVGRLTDGDFETAWNSATMEPGATAPSRISVVLPADVQVQSIEMTAGYTKVSRGRDLFVQNLRVRHVRILHDSDVFEADLDIDERGLQSIPVNGSGGEWRIELSAWEPGENEDYRELCVSELRFMGLPGAQRVLQPIRDSELTDLERAERDAEMAEIDAEIAAEDAEAEAELAALNEELEAADLEDDAPMDARDDMVALEAEYGNRVEIASREGLRLTELVLAPELDGRTPVDARSVYRKSSDDRVHCFFRLENPTSEATSVSLAWEDEEGNSRNEPTVIPVPARRSFTHWRFTGTEWRRPGSYRCVLRDAEQTELGHAYMELVE